MWNIIRMATHGRRKSYADMSIESLENHFSNRFSDCQNTRYVQTCDTKNERNFKKLAMVVECVEDNVRSPRPICVRKQLKDKDLH